MLNRRLMIALMALSLFGFIGLTGCKSVCEKAADHMKGCLEEICAEDEENPMCAGLDEAAEASGDVECTAAAEEMAQEMLDKSCDEIFGTGGGE